MHRFQNTAEAQRNWTFCQYFFSKANLSVNTSHSECCIIPFPCCISVQECSLSSVMSNASADSVFSVIVLPQPLIFCHRGFYAKRKLHIFSGVFIPLFYALVCSLSPVLKVKTDAWIAWETFKTLRCSVMPPCKMFCRLKQVIQNLIAFDRTLF